VGSCKQLQEPFYTEVLTHPIEIRKAKMVLRAGRYFGLLILFLMSRGGDLISQTFHFTSIDTDKLYTIDALTCEVAEIADLNFPKDIVSEHHDLTALTFHPDGKTYAVTGWEIVTLDIETGKVTTLYHANNPIDISLLSITVDIYGKLLLGYDNLNFYDPEAGEFTYNPGALPSSNITRYNNKLFSSVLSNFYYLDIHKTPYGAIDQYTVPGLSEMIALTTYTDFCNKEIIYGIDHNLEKQSRLYRIDPEGHMLDTLCTIPISHIAAMGTPFLNRNIEVQPDFDVDNSSGHTGDGFWTQWSCTGSADLTDRDVSLRVCDRVDSILFKVVEAQIEGNDIMTQGNDLPKWINTEGWDTSQIKTWLTTITAQTEDLRANQTIKTVFYAGAQHREIWTVIKSFDDPFLHSEVDLDLCNYGHSISLDSALDVSSTDLNWGPQLKDGLFDPEIHDAGTYTVTRSGLCPDTLDVNISLLSPDKEWHFPSLTICPTDQLSIDRFGDNDIRFSWEDNDQSFDRIFTASGSYPYRVSQKGCMWMYDLNLVDGQDCHCSIYIPNAFSPNGDAVNDVFTIPNSDCADFRSLTIFDRWGTKVFESSGDIFHWDGGSCPNGVYVYSFAFFDKKSNAVSALNGDITLIR